MIAASGFASTTSYPPTASANVSAQSSIGVAKLDVPVFSMPASQMGDAIQAAGVKNGDTMGNNGRESEQARAVVVKLGLNQDQATELHGAITKRGLSYQQVLKIGIEMFEKSELMRCPA